MEKTKNKFGILEKIELISALVYIIAGGLLNTFVGLGVSLLTMSILMLVFTVLLIVFFRQHTYGQDKPLLTALSIYYKSVAYVTIIFTMSNLPGKDTVTVVAIASMLIYGILAYFNGKKYYQMLNAYLYLHLIASVRIWWIMWMQ